MKKNLLVAIGLLIYSSVQAFVPFYKSSPQVEDIRSQWFYDEEGVLVKKIQVYSSDEKNPLFCRFLKTKKSECYVLKSDYEAVVKAQRAASFKYKNANNDNFVLGKLPCIYFDICDSAGSLVGNPEQVKFEETSKKMFEGQSIGISKRLGLSVDLDSNAIYCNAQQWFKIDGVFLPSNFNSKEMILMTTILGARMECEVYKANRCQEVYKAKEKLLDLFTTGFGTENAFTGLRNDTLYKLPFSRCTRPVAFVGGIVGSAALFKITIYNWFLSRPVNYFFGDYILTFQVWQKIRKMIVTPKFMDITYGKKLDEMLDETAKKMKAMEPIQGKGLILHGKPGNGKTLLFEQLAYRSGAIFLNIDASKVLVPISDKDKSFSVEKTLRSIFSVGKFYRTHYEKPVIIFWDELDAFFKKRINIKDPILESRVNALLVQLNDMDPKSGIYFCGATNNLHSMDPALMRAGRAGRIIELKDPVLDEIQSLVLKFFAVKKVMPKVSNETMKYICNIMLGFPRANITDILERWFENIDSSLASKTLTSEEEEIAKKLLLKLVNNAKDSLESQKELEE